MSFTPRSAATPFSPQLVVKTLYQSLSVMRGINSPVFAYFVRGGGVSCTRQMVKVRLDGAPLKRDVIEMK